MKETNKKEVRFGFGKNWQHFLPVVDERRVELAKKSLLDFLELPNLEGKTFVDIGSGSGLFSYAAFLLGAKRIVSFDYDQFSVEATKSLKERAGNPDNWVVEQGSALDTTYLSSLGAFDIVYSWGVLHHTGSMWEAVSNTAKIVAPDGYYYIALYNNVEGRFGSRFWLMVKRRYNKGSSLTKLLIEWAYTFVYFILAPLLRGKNPFRMMREYGKERGMHYRRDVADWVGGYPYEYATPEQVFQFLKKEYPTFRLENMKTVGSIGNNSFLFRNDR
jgi:2-polyprenyl-6-hydroxyphenyl methylase/3-demethylubiquinone-9 3-methyltransferase